MDKKEILGEIESIMRDVFDDDDLVVTENLNSNDIEDWDSLSNTRLVVSIEKRFNIKFAFGELQSLNNVGEMVEVIVSKLK